MSRSRYGRFALVLAAAVSLAGCGKRYLGVSLSDPRFGEFKALLSVNRSALGIPALPAISNVSVEWAHGASYDAMLHVYAGHEQRTIAFRREGGVLRWVGEQVAVDGPRQFTGPDGTINESISLTYDTANVAGYPLNQLNVMYWGPDQILGAKRHLTLSDVKPLLDQWAQRP